MQKESLSEQILAGFFAMFRLSLEKGSTEHLKPNLIPFDH